MLTPTFFDGFTATVDYFDITIQHALSGGANANVYLSAGLSLNAKRELETALQLAPSDAATLALLKRIAKSS